MPLLNSVRTWLLIGLCLISTSLINAQNLSRKDANEKIVELKQLVRELERSVKSEERNQRRLIGEYDRTIEEREQEISRLKKLLYGPFLPGTTPRPTLPPPPPAIIPKPGNNFPDPAPLYAQIADLQKEISRLNGQNKAQREYIQDLESSISGLTNKVDSLEQVIFDLKDKFNALEDLYKIQKEMLDCLRATAAEKQLLKNDAQSDLILARKYYSEFISSFENPDSAIGRAQEDTLLSSIYNIYERYGEQTIDKICGDVPYSYTLEYLEASDHLILANILARFPRHLLNKFGQSTDQRVAKSNSVLLGHISSVLEKGDYNQRAQALRLLDILPELIVAGASVDVGDSTGTKIFTSFQLIPQYFRQRNYPKVISEYSKYQRYEGEERFQASPEALAAARYCAGMVLLFDLGQVSEARYLVMPGSYLSRKGLSNQKQTGRQLLNQVIDMVPNNGQPFKSNVKKWQVKAAYGLSKNYGHQSKKPIR